MANYDYTFRQLMSEYPERSWVLVYNQMWNLSMRDPLHKVGRNMDFSGGKRSGGNSGSSQGSNNHVSQRNDYCWRFNKNRCKFGQRCRYEHKWFYCDTLGHGLYNCNKKNNKRKSEDHHRRSQEDGAIDHSPKK